MYEYPLQIYPKAQQRILSILVSIIYYVILGASLYN